MHVVTSLITGVVATTVAAPFDLVKSRVMASDKPTDGFFAVLGRLLRHEGPLALFNGWYYMRILCILLYAHPYTAQPTVCPWPARTLQRLVRMG